ACLRTYPIAAKPSAIANFTIGATIGSNGPRVITSFVGSSVLHSTNRYFSTNPFTPRAASQRATSFPSLSIESAKNAPPGQMIAAVPVFFAGSAGKNAILGLDTLKTTGVFQKFDRFSCSVCFQSSDPGAGPS